MGLSSRVFFDHYIYNLFYPDIDYVFSRIYHCSFNFFSVSISQENYEQKEQDILEENIILREQNGILTEKIQQVSGKQVRVIYCVI